MRNRKVGNCPTCGQVVTLMRRDRIPGFTANHKRYISGTRGQRVWCAGGYVPLLERRERESAAKGGNRDE